MQHGGFAYYKRRSEDMQQVMVEHALYGMGQFYEFLHSALSELPPVLTSTRADVLLVEELRNPDRVKLFEPAAMQAAASVLSDGPDRGNDALHELSDYGYQYYLKSSYNFKSVGILLWAPQQRQTQGTQ